MIGLIGHLAFEWSLATYLVTNASEVFQAENITVTLSALVLTCSPVAIEAVTAITSSVSFQALALTSGQLTLGGIYRVTRVAVTPVQATVAREVVEARRALSALKSNDVGLALALTGHLVASRTH